MQRKLAGYVFLSLFSFGVFTTLFHTVANAQTTELRIPVPSLTPNLSPAQPTPQNQQAQSIQQPPPTVLPSTVQFTLQSVEPTPTSKPELTKQPQPTPTKQVVSALTPTPTAQTTDKAVLAASAPTPTSIPQPQPTIAVAEDLEGFFTKYAAEYSVDKDDLKRIAKCEAGFNSQADTGLYAGMYQFHAQTWASTRNAMGLDPNPDLRKNAEESIKTAAFKIKNGGRGAWPNC